MLLDIGVGILTGIGFDAVSEAHALSTFVLVGILGSLSPDFDFIYHILRGGTTKNDHRHREVLHNPIFLLIGWVVIYAVSSPELAWLFFITASLHFLHDSIGIGWGVQWLWPIRTDHYTFFYRVHTANKPKPPKRMIYIWPNQSLDELHVKYGDADWFKNTYLKAHPYAIFEAVVFALAIAVLVAYTI